MKFTTEQAVEALRAELTNKGRKTLHMSERTLAKQAEILVKKLANEETGLPEFVADAIEILNEFEGDARKKNSDFAKYKELHPESNPNPPINNEPPKSTENPEMKALIERIAALEKDKAESVKKASIAQKRKDITARLKEKGVKDDEWLNDFLSEVNITEDFDVDAKTESFVKLYNKSKANNGNSVPPASPNGDSSNSAIAQSIKAASALAKKERERVSIESKN
ncbi:hypothetical protein [Clavibacter sp.]|uniref:hypothetical protein n=1 Tax=Clavibacter sp. TaxID=1871044 RepID=UPI0019C758E4|nr:hypothetical protein [Clavibacter sp.]MBD5381964.1 hypothetical protein [Clavibacter sp.]